MKRKLFLYFYALVTLKPSQLFFYVLRRIVDFRKNYSVSGTYQARNTLPKCQFLEYRMGAGSAWEFRFLNQTRHFEAYKPDWVSADMPRLWRYNLHYFDFLQDPELDQSTKDFLINDWINKNPVGTETAWEPYTLSLRLVNWIKFLMHRGEAAELHPEVIQSLALQSYWLSKNLEKHILANHYFKNIKAMVFAGIFLDGKDSGKWLDKALMELTVQVNEQSLADGGHYERSPMYHSIYLEDLLDLLQIIDPNGESTETFSVVKHGAINAALFHRDLRMPDSRIPLFNDAAFGIAPESKLLLRYAADVLQEEVTDTKRFPAQTMFESTGYFMLGDGMNRMIIDCGETGPRYQPGHTHCDTLSYELAVKGITMIVDSGTYDYQPGEKRAFDRSTRAHNTVMIDGQEQSEVWGLFRVARRASPLFAKFSKTSRGSEFSGAHNGYHRLAKPVTHQRDVEYDESSGWSVTDILDGQGTHLAESYIHFHPEISINIVDNRLILKDTEQNSLAVISIEGDVELDLQDSVYHPGFGIEESNKAARIWCRTELPVRFGYTITIAETDS